MAVLVVDDERNFRRVVEAKLRKSSFDVALAPDAAGALDLALRYPFELVLLDLHLPDADGIALLRLVRAAMPATPVIVMTAYEEEGLRERAATAGADDVLYKPFDLDELAQTVAHYIRAGRPSRPAMPITPAGIPEGQAVLLTYLTEPSRDESGRIAASGPDTLAVVGVPEAPPGTPVEVRIPAADGVYTFRSRIMQVSAPGVVALAPPVRLRHEQRRRDPRLPCAVPIRLMPVDGAEEPPEAARAVEAGALAGVTVNVSLGGALMVSERATPPGAVRLADLGPWDHEEGHLRSMAEVVRVEAVEAGGALRLFRLGLRFTRMRGEARHRLRRLLEGRAG